MKGYILDARDTIIGELLLVIGSSERLLTTRILREAHAPLVADCDTERSGSPHTSLPLGENDIAEWLSSLDDSGVLSGESGAEERSEFATDV